MTYRLYGLRLESATPLPGLPVEGRPGPCDVTFVAQSEPAWASDVAFVEVHRSEEREGVAPVLVMHEAEGGRLRLTYGEGIVFHLDAPSGAIWAAWAGPLTIDDAVTFLVGPVLGLFLRRRGALVLHASAVVLYGRAIALVGAAGQGKSTLAAALVTRGSALLSDDLLVLEPTDSGWLVHPGYPLVRLWEDSAALLLGPRHDLPQLSPTWDKRAFAVGAGGTFQASPAPLAGIVVLEGAREGALIPAVLPAEGAPTLLGVIANTYGAHLLGDAARAPELAAIARLVAAVRVVRLERPPAADPRAVALAVESWAAATTSP